MTRRARVRAPELVGRGWLNTDGHLSLRALRGRLVLLDFWTSCCVNCLHVLDELGLLEARWVEELVVIGVHSPKFPHEADPEALRAAVARHAVSHPVLDDADLVTWQAYTARAWPTWVLIDPEGYVVTTLAGEGHAATIEALLWEQVDIHRRRGTLQPGGPAYVAPVGETGDLRFPASAVALPGGDVLVADAGHGEVVRCSPTGEVVSRTGGSRGPQGLCLLPHDLAAEVGYDVVVADTAGHRLVGLVLATGATRLLAGDGTPGRAGEGTTRLSSPWDVAWWQDRVWVAMAGIHQLWTLDPRTGVVEVAAGTGHEGLLDGPLAEAWLAQTSGLAPDGDRLWLVDAETSSLRWVAEGQVRTAIGSGLFDFGFRDGPAEQALLQHPLDVTVLPDGSVAVCDTYNGAVRRFDPATGRLTTLATALVEPSGAHVDGAELVVVESGAHRLTRVPLGSTGTTTDGFSHSTQRPVAPVAAEVDLVVDVSVPPGQEVDERAGPAAQLVVEATPAALVRSGGGRGCDLVRRLVLDPGVGEGVLHVAARVATCDTGGGPGAACRVHHQDWDVAVEVSPGGPTRLALRLGGEA